MFIIYKAIRHILQNYHYDISGDFIANNIIGLTETQFSMTILTFVSLFYSDLIFKHHYFLIFYQNVDI